MTYERSSTGRAKMLSAIRARAIALFILTVAFVVAFTAASPTSSEAQQSASVGLERAHAHNDYEHNRPLFDALVHGFKSVEADIWLVNGELIIAHDPEDVPQAVQEGRILRSLYLDPLQTVVSQNGGSVY
jgi:hypothetical protein